MDLQLEALAARDEATTVVETRHPCRFPQPGTAPASFQMNTFAHSLFPGLDGYARSLGIYHPVFDWV